MKKALIQLHIAVFLAGFTAVLGKLIGLNEGLLVWYRLLITVIALWLIFYFRKSTAYCSKRCFKNIWSRSDRCFALGDFLWKCKICKRINCCYLFGSSRFFCSFIRADYFQATDRYCRSYCWAWFRL